MLTHPHRDARPAAGTHARAPAGRDDATRARVLPRGRRAPPDLEQIATVASVSNPEDCYILYQYPAV